MELENQTINLPIGEVNNPSPTFNMGRIAIGQSLKDAIYSSSYTISEISEHIKVSENTIRRWSNGGFKYIRKGNVRLLADLLEKKIVFDNETVEFENIPLIITETDNLNLESDSMGLLAEDIIEDLRADKNDLRDRISMLNKENENLSTLIKSMDLNIKDLQLKLDACTNNTVTMPILELDKYQNVVDLRSGTFVNISPLFAEKLGYSVFELVGQKWEVVIPPKDIGKWGVEVAQTLLDNEEKGIKEPCEVATEITEYDVDYLTKSGKILKSKCKSKRLSTIITMNEIEFLD